MFVAYFIGRLFLFGFSFTVRSLAFFEKVFEIIKHRPDGKDHGEPQAAAADQIAENLPIVRRQRQRKEIFERGVHLADLPKFKSRKIPTEIRNLRHTCRGGDEQRDDGHRLRPHFYLADAPGLNDHALACGNGTQARDDELSAYNYDDCPGRREIFFYKNYQGRGDQKLVGDRIEELTERRNLVALARKMPVEHIRESRDEEKRDRYRVAADAEPRLHNRRQQNHDDKRDNDDTRKCERVWQIHVS